MQAVKSRCIGKHAPHGIKILPFDLTGPVGELQQAAAQAVNAFPGAPFSYLVHNAGDNLPCCGFNAICYIA